MAIHDMELLNANRRRCATAGEFLWIATGNETPALQPPAHSIAPPEQQLNGTKGPVLVGANVKSR
jgi:hypothetical protein